MISHTQAKAIVIADYSKFGRVAEISRAPSKYINVLVTSRKIPHDFQREFELMGGQVVIAWSGLTGKFTSVKTSLNFFWKHPASTYTILAWMLTLLPSSLRRGCSGHMLSGHGQPHLPGKLPLQCTASSKFAHFLYQAIALGHRHVKPGQCPQHALPGG